MRHNKIIDMLLLKPLSWLYGFGVYWRNRMFDLGVYKQREFDVPVVVIGNIAVGGTGKTPHTEYVINALSQRYHIGVLSRGYRRHTKGFVLASQRSTPWDIGDEPYQIYQKFGRNVRVAVCEKRVDGIEQLLSIDPEINLIVLDDAFQHRYVKPRAAVVLTEWNRPVYNDDLMPLGRLREPASALNRADIVIVTKCPAQVKPLDIRLVFNHLDLFPSQKLYFSRYLYGGLVSVFPDETDFVPYLDMLTKDDAILLIAGIANPRPFVKHIRRYHIPVSVKCYPDHYNFERKDFLAIKQRFDSLQGRRKFIITTEKDAVRIANSPYYPHELKPVTFYIPITVDFLPYVMPQSNTPTAFESELQKIISRPRF